MCLDHVQSSYRFKQTTPSGGKIWVLAKGGGNTLHAPDPPPDPVRSAPQL